MTGFDRLWVWGDDGTAKSLAWYRSVASDREPAKFRIAGTIPVPMSLREASEDALWGELDRLTAVFLQRWRRVRERREVVGPPAPAPTLLDLTSELTRRMLAHCDFCRWDCGVDRGRGTKLGACKLAADTRVSTYFHHPGEANRQLSAWNPPPLVVRAVGAHGQARA